MDVNAEQAVILWDAATKTEHFIRAASFTSTSADFGFLVPTPTLPTLHEADARLFDSLGRRTVARVEYQKYIVEYDADVLTGAELVSFLHACGLPAKSAAQLRVV